MGKESFPIHSGPSFRNSLTLTLTLITLLLVSNQGLANVIKQDPRGFQGHPWGSHLSEAMDLVLVDRDDHVRTYTYQKKPPTLWDIRVESIKLQTVNNQFARALIRYRGEKTHQLVIHYLESNFGSIQLPPGSMIRGLNQQYTWRGAETEISINYRGLGERGFLTVQSRVLAPRFLDSMAEHSF